MVDGARSSMSAVTAAKIVRNPNSTSGGTVAMEVETLLMLKTIENSARVLVFPNTVLPELSKNLVARPKSQP